MNSIKVTGSDRKDFEFADHLSKALAERVICNIDITFKCATKGPPSWPLELSAATWIRGWITRDPTRQQLRQRRRRVHADTALGGYGLPVFNSVRASFFAKSS
jgi:hypothetical protein